MQPLLQTLLLQSYENITEFNCCQPNQSS